MIPDMCRFYTPSATTRVGWAVPPASGTTGRLQTGEMYPMVPPLEVWDPTYLHLAPAFYVLSATAIDTSHSGDPNVTLL